ncbi:hypothetical protein APV47_05815 [Staphylococcus aureus]|uniref:Phage protein n=1 Tax=Staphylococcus epidermidis TaxID=1282 RepID=A0A0D4ZYQ2_STAEP|nr:MULTISPECIES: hypothetical protein [Staphylococcus]AJW29160.1 phage protein [Staphylococcus epidermidis]ARA73635.1 hypothetical protein [Staphylococcus epidermidis]KZG49410.1 hypothetical protein A4U44_00330 [Staphylococcus epidermidis]KZG55055.1 hypothetical protein A0W31_03925 [Staphylococcus epidermidis]KZG55366.1 hypothetical protein A0W30_06230 [Staphylococcus epidermidis]
MFVTKEEFKNIDVEQVFKEGHNFIKITIGRHEIFKVNSGYKVIDYKKGIGLTTTNKIPKYIQNKI